MTAELEEAGVEVLFDDRDVRPGEKFADADLMGLPFRIVVSERTLQENAVEFKARTSDTAESVDRAKIVKYITSKIRS